MLRLRSCRNQALSLIDPIVRDRPMALALHQKTSFQTAVGQMVVQPYWISSPATKSRGRNVDTSPNDVTRLLAELNRGNEDALAELMPLLYAELKRLAGHYLRQEALTTRCRQPPWFTKHTFGWLASDSNSGKTKTNLCVLQRI